MREDIYYICEVSHGGKIGGKTEITVDDLAKTLSKSLSKVADTTIEQVFVISHNGGRIFRCANFTYAREATMLSISELIDEQKSISIHRAFDRQQLSKYIQSKVDLAKGNMTAISEMKFYSSITGEFISSVTLVDRR